MKLKHLEFKNHPILKNLKIDFLNDKGEVYPNIIFVGENGCGKTAILNELFNYDDSKYIINKEKNINLCGECLHKSIYVAQDIKFRNAINNINEKIKGDKLYRDITSIENTNGFGGANVMSFNKNNIANSSTMLAKKVKIFNNNRISEQINSGKLNLMNDISKQVSIDEHIDVPKIDTFSSGEQEILLRLEAISNRIKLNLDMLLLDEPENSLHPKWQQIFVPFIIDILKDNQTGLRDLQLFIASHSENVLKSVFNRNDTLIIRLFKNGEDVNYQKITNMDIVLDYPTFAEIQYLIFGIVSVEYHNQLYGKFLSLIGNQNNIDRYFKKRYKNNVDEVLNSYNYMFNNTIEVLPNYVRNATCHPENTDREYTYDEIKKSTELLRKEIKEYLIRNKKKMI
ncbi:MAG: AAA family ATPase [Bacilli bacterium]|nr:AAA family ATPase [Bacilli bacterium]